MNFLKSPQNGGPNFIKLGKMLSLVIGIKVCANEWPHLFSRRDNIDTGKMHWKCWKIFFSRITVFISFKHGNRLFWWMELKDFYFHMKGHALFQAETKATEWKCIYIFKELSSPELYSKSSKTWNKASLGEGNSRSFKWRTTFFSQGTIIATKWKVYLQLSKFFFSRTTALILPKLGSLYPFVKSLSLLKWKAKPFSKGRIITT